MHPLAPYPDLDSLHAHCTQAGQVLGAERVVYGQSVQGRPLIAYRIPCARPGSGTASGTSPGTSSGTGPKQLLLGANLHGVEVIGAYLAMRAMQLLAQPEPCALRALTQEAQLWVIPCYNPDAYALTFERKGRGSVAELRTNANGVDLNRNFPRPSKRAPHTFGFAGSSKPGAATYKGSAALSEPESRHLFEWLGQTPIHAALNLHSFSGGLIPARVQGAADHRQYKALHRAYLSQSPKPYFFCLHSRWLDAWTGELEDAQHHLLGTWACCIELVTLKEVYAAREPKRSTFWRFNPKDPERHAQRELPRLAQAFRATLAFPAPRERISVREVWDLQAGGQPRRIPPG